MLCSSAVLWGSALCYQVSRALTQGEWTAQEQDYCLVVLFASFGQAQAMLILAPGAKENKLILKFTPLSVPGTFR